MNWRPDDWRKQRSRHEYDGHDINCYEAGASAMLAALVKTIELNCGDGHDRPLIQIGVEEWQDFKHELGI